MYENQRKSMDNHMKSIGNHRKRYANNRKHIKSTEKHTTKTQKHKRSFENTCKKHDFQVQGDLKGRGCIRSARELSTIPGSFQRYPKQDV